MAVSTGKLVKLVCIVILLNCVQARNKQKSENDVIPKINRHHESDKDICQGKPADVVFLLDGSGSIWFRDFETQLQFIQDVVQNFDISPNMTQIGAVSFSNWAFLEFHLSDYSSKSDIKRRVGEIRQMQGDTNTAAALEYLRTVSFREEHGARRGIPHIAIILTDGKSNIPTATGMQAQLAREAGIHIFAIGVGSAVEQAELDDIANPGSAFHVSSYSALDSIKETLAIDTCKVPEPTTTVAPPTEPPVQNMCGDSKEADIVFALSPHGSAGDTEMALEFYKRISGSLELDEDSVRVGLVPKDCGGVNEISLDSHDSQDLLERLEELHTPVPTTSATLRYMRRVSFHPRHGGARSKARKVGVVIVDSPPSEQERTLLKEAQKTRKNKGVELFVVGVGKRVEPQFLESLASRPADQHVFHVSNYSELVQIAPRVSSLICPVTQL